MKPLPSLMGHNAKPLHPNPATRSLTKRNQGSLFHLKVNDGENTTRTSTHPKKRGRVLWDGGGRRLPFETVSVSTSEFGREKSPGDSSYGPIKQLKVAQVRFR